jgi:uncharacterized Ntn-hydrolase superfamily protein
VDAWVITHLNGVIGHPCSNGKELQLSGLRASALGSVLLALGALVGCGRMSDLPPASRTSGAPAAASSDVGIIATFSIVAVDPATGICGAAVASKYPSVGKVVPYVRGGAGAFCTQHFVMPTFGPKAIEMLEQDKPPGEILSELVRQDDRAGTRQLAVIDRHGRTAQLNPIDAPQSSRWWGAMSGRFYACQGNTLTGSDVITSMAAAYETIDGSLADRLMAALVAGDCAGGDHRGRLAAAIVVDKPDFDGTWLELRVDKSDDAVLELAKMYVELEHEAKGTWSNDKKPWQHPCPDRPAPQPPKLRESDAAQPKPSGP